MLACVRCRRWQSPESGGMANLDWAGDAREKEERIARQETGP